MPSFSGSGALGGGVRYGSTGAGIGTAILPGLGTLIGGAAGALGGALYGGFSGGAEEDQAEKLAHMYDNLQYQDPMANPAYAAAMQRLQALSSGRMTPEDKAREYEALSQANQQAQGQQGAIAQEELARGGGVAHGGMQSALQQVSSQGSTNRLAHADVATAGMAAQRGLEAQREFMRQMQQNAAMQNQFAMQKTGGAAGVGAQYLDFLGQQNESNNLALQHTGAMAYDLAKGYKAPGAVATHTQGNPVDASGVPVPEPQDGGIFSSDTVPGAITASQAAQQASKAFSLSDLNAQMMTNSPRRVVTRSF